MTMPTTGQPDPNVQADPNAQVDPNAQAPAEAPKPDEAPKSVEEQLAELTSQMEDLKKNSRKWETRAKENKVKADELDRLQAANATPDQKFAAAEEKAAKAESELARFRVAQRTGLDLELVDLLNGDEDDMEEQAKKLLARLAAKPAKSAPKPDPSQGGTGDSGKRRNARDEGLAEARRRFGSKS